MIVNDHLKSPYINSRSARLKDARSTLKNMKDARLGARIMKVR